jgi:hypothetical protein
VKAPDTVAMKALLAIVREWKNELEIAGEGA